MTFEVRMLSSLLMDQPGIVAETLEPCLRAPVGAKLLLDLTDLQYSSAFGIAALGARLMWLIRTRRMPSGSTIRRPASNRLGNELVRMGLVRLVQEASDSVYRATDPQQRPQELWVLDREADLEVAAQRLCLLLRGVLPAPEDSWAKVAEVMRRAGSNVFRHAQAVSGAVLCGQAYPRSGYVEFAVADTGRGLREALAQQPGLNQGPDSDLKAVQAVLGVRLLDPRSGESRPGTLATLAATARRNGGEMAILSGAASLHLRAGDAKAYGHKAYPGTVVGMRLYLVKDL